MNKHKKNAGLLFIIELEALVSPFINNRTTARAYTIYKRSFSLLFFSTNRQITTYTKIVMSASIYCPLS